MALPVTLLTICLSFCFLTITFSQHVVRKNAPERIADAGFPVETHTVQTNDGYILTMHRIPCENNNERKVVFLLHGMISSSDSWLIGENATAFSFARAGFDVWLGNVRGNHYSRQHVSKSPIQPSFWDFSWNEHGKYDLPAMLDYVLNETEQEFLHYVGHSMGTTTFLTMSHHHPQYNLKFKTVHLMAPSAYQGESTSVLLQILNQSGITGLIPPYEFVASNELLSLMGRELCESETFNELACANIYFLMGGARSDHTNTDLIPTMVETHPAGASTKQFLHYQQSFATNAFRKYNYGLLRNLFEYGQATPPDYNLFHGNDAAPIFMYYSDSDPFGTVADVERLGQQLGPRAQYRFINLTGFNHLDFQFATDIESIINEPIKQGIIEFSNVGP